MTKDEALKLALAALDEAPQSGSWINAEDVNRHVRALDIALNGEENCAVQPLLIDILSQVQAEAHRLGRPLLQVLEREEKDEHGIGSNK